MKAAGIIPQIVKVSSRSGSYGDTSEGGPLVNNEPTVPLDIIALIVHSCVTLGLPGG